MPSSIALSGFVLTARPTLIADYTPMDDIVLDVAVSDLFGNNIGFDLPGKRFECDGAASSVLDHSLSEDS